MSRPKKLLADIFVDGIDRLAEGVADAFDRVGDVFFDAVDRNASAQMRTQATSQPWKPPRFQRTMRAIVAAHEAGHLIQAWFSPYVRRIESVEIHSQGGGIVKYIVQSQEHSSYAWFEVACKMGGIAGESVVFSRFRSHGARDDILRALKDATTVATQGDECFPPWVWIQDPPSFSMRALYAQPLHSTTVTVLDQSYVRAKKLIRKEEQFFYGVVSALIEKRFLSETDLEKIYGRRRPTLPRDLKKLFSF